MEFEQQYPIKLDYGTGVVLHTTQGEQIPGMVQHATDGYILITAFFGAEPNVHTNTQAFPWSSIYKIIIAQTSEEAYKMAAIRREIRRRNEHG